MGTVNTVTGPIDSAELGPTLMHEHLFISFGGDAASIEREPALARTVRQLQMAREAGIQTIVDPAPASLGRAPELLKEAAEQAQMQVVATTGLYTDANIPQEFREMSVEQIAESHIQEIEEGIDGSGVKAGIIKCATGRGEITEQEAKALHAAGRVVRATGVPIITHTANGTMGQEQLDIFEAEGVPFDRVIIGHSDDNTDPAYHVAIAERGAFVGFDHIGHSFVPDEQQLETIRAFVDNGYADHLILSHDAVAWFARGGNPGGEQGGGAQRDEGQREKFRMGFSYISNVFLPKLVEAGVSREVLDRALTDNPRRYFG